jgi:hypothetical protein
VYFEISALRTWTKGHDFPWSSDADTGQGYPATPHCAAAIYFPKSTKFDKLDMDFAK